MAYTPELLARVAELEALPWQKIEAAATTVGVEKPSGSSWKEQALTIAIAEFESQDLPIEADSTEAPAADIVREADVVDEPINPEPTAKDRFFADLGIKLEGPNQVPVPLEE